VCSLTFARPATRTPTVGSPSSWLVMDQETGSDPRACWRAALLHPPRRKDCLGRWPEDLIQHLPPPKDLPPASTPRRSALPSSRPRCRQPALLQVNPEYLACLLALPVLERERLLGVIGRSQRPALFQRSGVPWSTGPAISTSSLLGFAATEKTELNDPDWTVGIKARPRPEWWLLAGRCAARAGEPR